MIRYACLPETSVDLWHRESDMLIEAVERLRLERRMYRSCIDV